MSARPGSGDLADDLAADLLADMTRDEVVPPVVTPPRLTTAETPPVYTVSGKLQVSPSQWVRPSVRFAPDGISTHIGPIHFELFLH